MKLLIKLCYSGSYTKEDGEELFDRSTRMRLAFLGNAFEMADCVSECLASLADDLTPTNALTALDDVPEELRGHEAMNGVTKNVIEILGDALDKWTESNPPTASEKDTKQNIVNALAKALGPVNQFFGEGISAKVFISCFYTCLPLKQHVLALSPDVLEALLASDALQVATENEVYTLLGSWLYQSPHAGAYDGIHPVRTARHQPLFCCLVKFVRFSNLSPNYLAAVVAACPLAAESGLLPYMLSLSLANRKAGEQGANTVLLDRGRGNPGYTFTSTFDLADVLTVVPETDLCKYVGLVDGYPLRLEVRNRKIEEKTSLGIFVYVLAPVWKTKSWEGGLRRTVNIEIALRAGGVQLPPFVKSYDQQTISGYPDLFSKCWEEIVHEGSAYFPDGRIKFEAGVRVLEDEE